jgi:hypothetical protein
MRPNGRFKVLVPNEGIPEIPGMSADLQSSRIELAG